MQMTNELPRLLSARKAALIYGIDRRTIKKWIDLGQLPVIEIDGQQLLRTLAIEQCLDKHQVIKSPNN